MPAEVVYRKSCLEKFRNTEKKTPVKKRLQHRCIPVNIGKFIFEEHLHTAASEVTLESDCLVFFFWRVAFKTILT